MRDGRQSGEINSKLERKRRAVLVYLERCFDEVGAIDARIQKHVRMEAARVLQNGMNHSEFCANKTCQVSIELRANGLIAICTFQACFERFLNANTIIAEISPESTKQDLIQSLERIKQLKLHGTGAAQRAQIGAIVDTLLDWTPRHVCVPCVSAPTDQSAEPQQLENLQESQPTVEHREPQEWSDDDDLKIDAVRSLHFTVRDIILSAARLSKVRADVRCAALAAAQEPEVSEWIEKGTDLPVDVLGVAVLSAAAKKLEVEDTTQAVLMQVCHQFFVSPTSAEQNVQLIQSMMKIEKSQTLGAFGDGIF